MGLMRWVIHILQKKNGVIQVSKGTLVVMKDKQFDNLYKMIGSSVAGGVALISEGLAFDDAMLWHMRICWNLIKETY